MLRVITIRTVVGSYQQSAGVLAPFGLEVLTVNTIAVQPVSAFCMAEFELAVMV